MRIWPKRRDVPTGRPLTSPDDALRCAAVLACLIVRSESFGTLPVHLYRTVDGGAFEARDHPAYRLLSVAPNELMTAAELWRWKQLTEDLDGNAYVRIVWRGSEPVELWPLYGAPPCLVFGRGRGLVAYEYYGDDFTSADAYAPRDVLHFKGPVLRTPWEGASLIDLASEAIETALGSAEFFARFLAKGAHFPGYFETDATLSDADFAAVAAQLRAFSGPERAGEVRVFGAGLSYHPRDLGGLAEAQLLEAQRWQLQQIASVFRVPLALVADLAGDTAASVEQQDLGFVKHCITPLCVATERTVNRALLGGDGAYLKFNVDGLLRADYVTRAQGLRTATFWGIMTRNEARALFDLDPLEGLDVPLSPLAFGTVDQDGVIHAPAVPDGPAAD